MKTFQHCDKMWKLISQGLTQQEVFDVYFHNLFTYGGLQVTIFGVEVGWGEGIYYGTKLGLNLWHKGASEYYLSMFSVILDPTPLRQCCQCRLMCLRKTWIEEDLLDKCLFNLIFSWTSLSESADVILELYLS